jgi:hypothetical protein
MAWSSSKRLWRSSIASNKSWRNSLGRRVDSEGVSSQLTGGHSDQYASYICIGLVQVSCGVCERFGRRWGTLSGTIVALGALACVDMKEGSEGIVPVN